jgi:Tfp pilus assembly protein PilF
MMYTRWWPSGREDMGVVMNQTGPYGGAGCLPKRTPLARWMPIAVTLVLAIASIQAQIPPVSDAMNKGVQAFRNGDYAKAANYLKQAVALDPKSVLARAYLATAYQMQYIPDAVSAENAAFAQAAHDEFLKVLELDPQNTNAMLSIARLCFDEKKPDEARDWCRRAIAIKPNDKTPYYTIGVLDWQQTFGPRMRARAELGMRFEDPGPLKDPNVRAALRAQNLPLVAEGIASLETALAIDPEYSDAMAYMNYLYRERADLQDTEDAWRSDALLANQWVDKFKAARARLNGGSPGREAQTAPPPPPPTGVSAQQQPTTPGCRTNSQTTVCRLNELVVSSTAERMEVTGAGAPWVIDLNRLPVLRSDCVGTCSDIRTGRYCVGNCNAHWPPSAFAYHPATGNFYFAISTDVAKNRPYVVLRANTRTRRIYRIGATWGAGVGMPAEVSASGRFLAYSNGYTAGACDYDSWIGVVDLQTLKHAVETRVQTGSNEWNDGVKSLRWLSEHKLEIRGERTSRQECSTATPTTRFLEITSLDWDKKTR